MHWSGRKATVHPSIPSWRRHTFHCSRRVTMFAKLRLPAMIFLIFVSSGCVRARGIAAVPMTGSPLIRIAELPGDDSGNDSSFSHACAMRLRESKSGQEYLLIRSNTQTTTEKTGNRTETSLVSATGDYAAISENPQLARLRVDCTSSRIIERLPAPNAR